MYVCMCILIVLILCMIKVRVIALGKLIGLLFLFYPPSLFVFENSKTTKNELARPVMGTIFLVYIYICVSVCMSTICQMHRRNYVAQTLACSKSVLGV